MGRLTALRHRLHAATAGAARSTAGPRTAPGGPLRATTGPSPRTTPRLPTEARTGVRPHGGNRRLVALASRKGRFGREERRSAGLPVLRPDAHHLILVDRSQLTGFLAADGPGRRA